MKKKGDSKKFIVSSSDTYYDDCPICQAMKKAEEEGRTLSEEELWDTFEKSKEAGGIVGTNKPPDKIES